jgi:large subunit ribosomal protein L30
MSEQVEKKTARTRKPKAPAAEKHLRITLVRSLIGYPAGQRRVARGLGLRKLNSSVVRRKSPEIMGMVRKIGHVLKVEEVEQP